MPYFRQLHLTTIITYAILAIIASRFINIHFIHLLNAGLLSAILYQILEWKYGIEEEE